jgi:hypothetical protein
MQGLLYVKGMLLFTSRNLCLRTIIVHVTVKSTGLIDLPWHVVSS